MFLSNFFQKLKNRGYVSLCLFAIVCLQCHSQTAAPFSYYSTFTPVATESTFGAYTVDSSGNIYVISSDGSSLLKETPFIGTYLQSTVSSGTLSDLLAVDGGGDVFRLSGGTLYEEVNQITGPTHQDTPYTEKVIYNFTDAIKLMVVDNTSHVYVFDATQNELLKLTQTSAGWGQSFVATGLSGVVSIGVDINQNVYALELNGKNGTVEKFTYTSSTTGYQGGEFTSGLTNPDPQIAVDSQGDVFVSQGDEYGAYNALTEFQAGTANQITIACPPVTCPIPGVNAGNNANVILAGPDGYLYFDLNGTIYKESFDSPNLGTVDVGKTATANIAYKVNSLTSSLSSLTASAPFAVSGFYGESNPYVDKSVFLYLQITFTPTELGAIQREIDLTTSPNPTATVTVQGTGAAPQIGFSPAPQSIILSSAAPYNLQGPEGIAVDGKGNLYIADLGGKQVLKETLSSGQYTQTVIANAQNGLRDPIGVAVDANGNVYIADQSVGILKETPTSSGYTQSTLITNGGPVGVAVDANGVLYFVNGTSVIKAVPSGGQYTETTLLSSLTPGNSAISTQGMAVDSSGNVYVTDTGNQRVLKFSPANGSYTQSTVASGFGFPWGVAVDFAGNVYVGDEGGGVYKESLSNGVYSQTLMNGSIEVAYGVAVDGSENVYAATSTPARIYEIPAVQMTTLSFASTPVGTTSPDSPQTLTVQNVGMYPLTFTIPGTGTNPSISAGFTIGTANGTASTCPDLFTSSTGAELMPGGSCTYQISFAPTTAGAISGSLTFTDNSNNVAGATQTIALLGTATAAAPTVQISATSLNFNSEPVGSKSTAQTVTLTNSGSAALAISSISASGDFASTNTCGTSVAAGAACTISVTFTPTASGTRAGTLAIADNATGSPQTVALSGTGATAVVTAPAVTLSPTSLTFASQTDGTTSVAQTLTLTNSGNAALTITGITASGDFAQTNTCATTVAAGSSCTISATFTPTAAGTRTGTLTITDNASGSPQTVALSGTGVALNGGGAVFTVSSNSTALTIASPGGTTTATISLSPQSGFSGTVNLICAVAYQGQGTPSSPPTCSLNPSQAQITGSPISSTLTVSTTPASAAAMPKRLFDKYRLALASLLFLGVLPRRRLRSGLLFAAFCFVALSGTLGCSPGNSGSGNNTPTPNPGTTTGNYQVTVTATSGTVTTSTTIPLSLQ
jgi:sugar lactone lactonase YvrE